MKKITTSLMAMLLTVMTLSACNGGSSGTGTNGGENSNTTSSAVTDAENNTELSANGSIENQQDEDATESNEGEASSTVPENSNAALCDTWENAYGEHGAVEYEYVEITLPSGLEDIDLSRYTYTDPLEESTGTIRKVSKMTLRTEAGEVWRIFEFDYHYTSAIDLYDESWTYDSDGNLLYRVVTYCTALDENRQLTGKIFKSFSDSYDAKNTQICEIYYTGTEWTQFEKAERDGIYSPATAFCIFAYDSQGRKLGVREYQMDGVQTGRWEYVWDGDTLTEVNRLNEYDGWSKYTAPEFDGEGRLTALYDIFSEDDTPLFTFTYDDQGRLVERTGYIAGKTIRYYQEFIYGADGKLVDCIFEATGNRTNQ